MDTRSWSVREDYNALRFGQPPLGQGVAFSSESCVVTRDQSEEQHDASSKTDHPEDEIKVEIEERQYPVARSSQLATKVRLCTTREGGLNSLVDYIHASCIYDGRCIGRAFARYIRRDSHRSNFWQSMDELSRNTSNLAYAMFDDFGYVKQSTVTDPEQRGTGVWGEELGFGPLLLIEKLEVIEEWRRHGLGRDMVDALMDVAEEQQVQSLLSGSGQDEQHVGFPELHLLVIPTGPNTERPRKLLTEQKDVYCGTLGSVIAFWESLGFRRIGTSQWLGLPLDPNHKSHTILKYDDFPPQEIFKDSTEEATSFNSDTSRDEQLMVPQEPCLPLHTAILTMADAECVAYFQTLSTTTAWDATDSDGNTILHLAAHLSKSGCAQWLMAKQSTLSEMRNQQGYTPLEMLDNALEDYRIKAENANNFSGFSCDAVACLSALRKLGDVHNLPAVENSRLTYGCTCGECMDGFLSPLTRLALIFQAEKTYELLINDEVFASRSSWGPFFEFHVRTVSCGLLYDFRTDQSLRQGFTDVFFPVAACLHSGVMPTAPNVLQFYFNMDSWSTSIDDYLEYAGTTDGKVEAALATLLQQAGRSFGKVWPGSFDVVMNEEIANVKRCRNDFELGLVRRCLGLPEFDYAVQHRN